MGVPEQVPSAPWLLTGEAVVAVVPGLSPAAVSLVGGLPAGVVRLPGPAVLVGASYSATPVGRYMELALAVPARLGLRPGLCVVWQVVSLPAARTAYRSNWGLPTVVGSLSWSSSAGAGRGGRRVRLRCEDPAISLEAVSVGRRWLPPVPMPLPMRSVQRRADGPVVLPRRMFGLARPVRCSVSFGEDPAAHALSDADAGLVGSHVGILLSSIRMTALPARHPAGFWSSLRAPLQVAEPAMSVGRAGGAAPTRVARPRALSSAG